MAEEVENDDQWLYGENPEAENAEPAENEAGPIATNGVAETKAPVDDGPPGVENIEPPLAREPTNEEVDNEAEDGELKANGDDSDKEDLEDDSDDDVNVVIGDIKAPTSYTQVNIKRGGLTTTISDKSKQIQQPGKFQVEEFEQIGTINGVPAAEYNLDSLEDKPWRKPGADITDYFNYGFNEDTWKAYCERQKRIRMTESGVGIMPLNSIGLPRVSMNVVNDNSKYNNFNVNTNPRPVAPMMKPNEPPKMNTIQVMTADRREYSRKPAGFPDLSVPPPYGSEFQPDFNFNPEPEPFYGGYEPTQDSQWMDGPDPNWQPQEIKTLTGGNPMGHMGPPHQLMGRSHSPGRRDSPIRDRDRESRSRSEKPRDHEREKSRRRERSRSRSRRHRSRSRSPGHRSHKKKKSRRHEDSD
ncbi:pre-mRNA 3'-end-processing factor FIP1-like [Cylas formicarius]|uniref:pre-mRNA 3'-end-processing factor FIP1-like n=1 Tax=Cylas formicarius TaxID=197179 RepID=UPI0029585C7F|nr:pre-mRNA 3'-end-processing factor FIP1-like [Cylas formicarius]